MTTTMNTIRRGTGKPLFLIHGLGGSWRSWNTILDELSGERDVIAVDRPGFGATPPLAGDVSIRTLADALTDFLAANDLIGIDAIGISRNATARLILDERLPNLCSGGGNLGLRSNHA